MDPVCPLETRYGRPAMKAIFAEKARLAYLVEVEAALAWAHSEVGTVPKKAAQRLQKVADATRAAATHADAPPAGRTKGAKAEPKTGVRAVTPERVQAIEAEIRHDLMAVVKAMSECAGPEAGKHVHLGATSYDTIDTANALQFRDALGLVQDGLRSLRDAIVALADQHRHTAMLGRTHGQAAVPITFGLKMAVFASEVGRHLARLEECKARVCVGMMSGATGSMAAFRDHGPAIQRSVCRRLGLGEVTASTQIVQRDRYVELFAHLANVATSLEKFATEVRTLQRTEIGEAAEGFDAKKQVGSSTMPQKQNPIVSEQVTGLARLARSLLTPVFENAIQWNERDLSNSAPERFIHPHAFILVDHCVHQMAGVFRNLRVNPRRMEDNMERAQGLMMAESVMITLSERGMGRQEAHEAVRQASMRAIAAGSHLREALLGDKDIVRRLGRDGIEAALDPAKYVGPVDHIIDKVIRETKGL